MIKSSHVFSLPSLVEGFGIVVVEAAASGLPYVISDIPTFKEITKNGKGGFLVNPCDPLSFSKKILDLMSRQLLYRKKSQEGLLLAKNYLWQEIAKRTEKTYLDLLNK